MADRGQSGWQRETVTCLEETVFAVVGGESVHGVAVGMLAGGAAEEAQEHHKGTRGHVSEKMEG